MFTSSGDRVFIKAGSYQNGFKSITINGIEIINQSINQQYNQQYNNQSSFNLLLIDRFHIHLSIYPWSFDIDNSDEFLNLARVRVMDWHKLVTSLKPHGLLGQTWKTSINST